MTATGYAEIQRQVMQRQEFVRKVVLYARHKGLDASFESVNKNLNLWQRWYTGNLATGYLIRATKVRKMPSE